MEQWTAELVSISPPSTVTISLLPPLTTAHIKLSLLLLLPNGKVRKIFTAIEPKIKTLNDRYESFTSVRARTFIRSKEHFQAQAESFSVQSPIYRWRRVIQKSAFQFKISFSENEAKHWPEGLKQGYKYEFINRRF